LSAFNIVLAVALVGLFFDAVRHIVAAWNVQLQSARRYQRTRPMSQSGFWLAEILHLPYPAAPVGQAVRYRRSVTWFLADVVSFVVVFTVAGIVNSV
jgi:hypothetical protein